MDWDSTLEMLDRQEKADVVMSVNVNISGEGGEAEKQKVSGWLENSINSLKVEDWGLFGDSEE
jgi:hypothetical protein